MLPSERARANRGPRLLFVPVSGADGAGEYYRSLAVADEAARRWPAAEISFVINRQAGYANAVPYATILIDRSPTYDTAAVNQALDHLRPDVIVFDSAGRAGQLAHARRLGVKTVYVSSRPKTRWKGFRLRRMHYIDQHWLAWPSFLNAGLTHSERLKLWLMGSPEVVFLESVFPPPDVARAAGFQGQIGVVGGEYLLFCAGGGGYRRESVPAPEIFAAAAAEVARTAGVPVVCVMGPNYAGQLSLPGTVRLDAVSGAQMIDLLAGARLAVINGGSLLMQALGVKAVCVAAPVATDQAARIAACAAQGLVVPAALSVPALVSATRALLEDAAHHRELQRRLATLGLKNGVIQAVDALSRLLSPGSSA